MCENVCSVDPPLLTKLYTNENSAQLEPSVCGISTNSEPHCRHPLSMMRCKTWEAVIQTVICAPWPALIASLLQGLIQGPDFTLKALHGMGLAYLREHLSVTTMTTMNLTLITDGLTYIDNHTYNLFFLMESCDNSICPLSRSDHSLIAIELSTAAPHQREGGSIWIVCQ